MKSKYNGFSKGGPQQDHLGERSARTRLSQKYILARLTFRLFFSFSWKKNKQGLSYKAHQDYQIEATGIQRKCIRRGNKNTRINALCQINDMSQWMVLGEISLSFPYYAYVSF